MAWHLPQHLQVSRSKTDINMIDVFLRLRQAGTGTDGAVLRDRWAGWDRVPFTCDSPSQVAVFEKNA
jgi:hypothetical protein